MKLDIISYELGKQKGSKDRTTTVVVDGENIAIQYDESTKTVTLTKGGENNG